MGSFDCPYREAEFQLSCWLHRLPYLLMRPGSARFALLEQLVTVTNVLVPEPGPLYRAALQGDAEASYQFALGLLRTAETHSTLWNLAFGWLRLAGGYDHIEARELLARTALDELLMRPERHPVSSQRSVTARMGAIAFWAQGTLFEQAYVELYRRVLSDGCLRPQAFEDFVLACEAITARYEQALAA